MARKPKINQRAVERHIKEIAKGYERAARRNPIRVPIQTGATAEGVSLADRDSIESSPILARLLMWLDAQARQHPSQYVDVTLFVEEYQLEDENPTVLALQLERRGLVDIARNLAGTPDVHLTDEGRLAVHQLRNLQKDRAARLRYTMDAFLRWLFDTAGDQAPVDPALFLVTPGSSFAGAAVSPTDLHQALAYLAEHSFMERIGTDPAAVTITPEGVDCILAGESVQDRTRSARSSTKYSDTLASVRNVISGQQQNAADATQDRFTASREVPPPAAQRNLEPVRSQATGDPKAYRRDPYRLPGSNQADVFRATHKATGTTVALKQLHVKSVVGMRAARMKREIEAGNALAGHLHAMPILDHAANYTWFVMPWADSTAEEHREALRDSQQLRVLVDALASVLAKAHRLGWIHRDIKPPNILLLEGQWVVADWGAVRRPPGQTTKVGRTATGIGSAGFSAPELFTNPDQRPQPSGDIYSIGRVIAWALTGDMPLPNKQLLPAPGPWRNIVRAATQEDPSRRPQAISDLIGLIEREFAEIPVEPLERATRLLEQANMGDTDAADAFLALLTDHADDYELYIGLLTKFTARKAGTALAHNLPQAHSVLNALTEHVDGDGTRWVQFAEASVVTIWLHDIAAHAAAKREWDLLEEAMQAMCTWDGSWDQWNARDKISPWLGSLRGDAAATAAAVLRGHLDSAAHFSHLAEDRTCDPRIRQAVRQEGDGETNNA
ncbi:phosphotransferase [Streptomyces sp. ISL-100]|uniref:protein kinase domain-containing protein n=1 Tax=Streptomyces sp. ISL-100 TaxID=2819173 RepID=UPI001BE640C3|nr:phosphotransferase [Streptomyces sp. ISL-100]MBT2398443.1 phosphotransferase [Streptomyces sp. ISL-100]